MRGELERFRAAESHSSLEKITPAGVGSAAELIGALPKDKADPTWERLAELLTRIAGNKVPVSSSM